MTMAARLDPRAWHLTVKIPLLVAGLMVALGGLASQLVLARLDRSHEEQVSRLATAYLEGARSAVTPFVERRDVWETFDVLDRLEKRYGGLDILVTFVGLPEGAILAASDPMQLRAFAAVPAEWQGRFVEGGPLLIDAAAERAWARRGLDAGGGEIGQIFAEIDIGQLQAERRNVAWTLILGNAAVTLALATLGLAVVRRMLRPLDLLSREVARLRDGKAPHERAIPRLRQPEFRILFDRFAEMADAVSEREQLAARLAREERLAQLGRLASGMAHEVNNPLGGMLTAVDTLKRHGQDTAVRADGLALLERGLEGVRDVVRAALLTWREPETGRPLTSQAFEDIRFLIQHEVTRRRLVLAWRNALPALVAIDSGPVRQAALNLMLNACRAAPVGGRVEVEAWLANGVLQIRVVDSGPGLPPRVRERFSRLDEEPPAPSEGGLGVWATVRLARRQGGRFLLSEEGASPTVIVLLLPTGPRAVA